MVASKEEYEKWLDTQPQCEECGRKAVGLNPHYEACSKYKHIVDDHYDSPCMRGTCKHCNGEVEKPVAPKVDVSNELAEAFAQIESGCDKLQNVANAVGLDPNNCAHYRLHSALRQVGLALEALEDLDDQEL